MKFILVILALVVVASCAPLNEKHYRFLFEKYQQKYNKKYSEDEVAFRYANFKENLEKVRAHNARSDVSFTVAMNHLADLSRDEYLSRLPKMTKVPGPYVPSGVDDWNVDWRNKGAVTPIKDQGQCGSCWSFSTSGTMEGSTVALGNGQLVSLSESYIVNCDSSCYGCDGCWPYLALEWVFQKGGDCSEADYPYVAEQQACNTHTCSPVTNCESYVNVQSGSESSLKDAVTKTPTSVAIDASNWSFQMYSGGVYDEPNCSSSQLDHAVLAVGYGTLDGTKAWIVKNSWGTGWGVNGYIYMSRDKNNQCGIATSAVYPTGCKNL